MAGLEAFALSGLAQASLLVAGLVVYWVRPSTKVIGGLAGFGAGALIAAVAFDLVPQAEDLATWETGVWLVVGSLIFVAGDKLVEKKYGAEDAGPLGIVVGSVVDGVPESIIFGIQIGAGVAISPTFLGAVFVSNLPQALAPSAALVEDGWPKSRMAGMWGIVVLACAVTGWLGYLLGANLGANGDRFAAIAAGGLLAMLTDSFMPYAMQEGGAPAGIWTVVGFAASLAG